MAAVLLLAGCGQPQTTTRAAQEDDTALDVAASADAPAAPAAGPQIAYSYRLSYLLDDDAIPAAQARAQAACRGLGPRRCLVTRTDLARSEGDGDAASLNLLIDARLAGGFERRLNGIATAAGGSATERHVTAEDVTKQIVDTGAKVRAKQALADRLLAIIRTANGKVGDLIEAEKAYAQVQEELDAARSLDAELRGRVTMSTVEINYASRRASGTWAPVARATDGLAGSFAASIAALVTFVAVTVPWAVLLVLVGWLLRRIGWRPRWPWRRRTPPPA